jgi:hypothetical protein
MESALRQEGLEERKLVPKRPKVWSLAGGDTIRFFFPHAYRRPWGFVYSGSIGVEIPSLRQWLQQHKLGDEVGIFHTCFVGYPIINEDILGEFMVEHDKPVPSDLWAGLLKDRLEKIPTTLDGLVAAYQRNKEELGWLAHPYDRQAWEFLLKWLKDPDPSLHVPRMLPNGQII